MCLIDSLHTLRPSPLSCCVAGTVAAFRFARYEAVSCRFCERCPLSSRRLRRSARSLPHDSSVESMPEPTVITFLQPSILYRSDNSDCELLHRSDIACNDSTHDDDAAQRFWRALRSCGPGEGLPPFQPQPWLGGRRLLIWSWW